MYKVNVVIKERVAIKPVLRVAGKNSRAEIASSIDGMNQLRAPPANAMSGELLSVMVKVWRVNNLLIAVYTNTRMKRAAMISIM